MKKELLVGALGTGDASAWAQTISIGLKEAGVNGDAITTVASACLAITAPTPPPTLGTYGSFNYLVNATDLTGTDLTSTATTLSISGVGTLYVYVSETGLTAGNTGATFDSGLAQNVLSAGDAATLSTWLDLNDGLYALAIPLASQTFMMNGTSTSSLTGLLVQAPIR